MTRMIEGLMAAGQKPRFHGNGFTQLYLAPDIRLHVWHPALCPIRDHNAAIHNHRYDVKSTVYSGRLIHTTYIVNELAPLEDHDVRIIQLGSASAGAKAEVAKASPDVETGVTGRLEVRHRYELTAGAVYTMRRPWFHSSVHGGAEPIVTIFERSNKGQEWAKVLCGIRDEKARHAFEPEDQPSQDDLWAAIEDGLQYAHKAAFRAMDIIRAQAKVEKPGRVVSKMAKNVKVGDNVEIGDAEFEVTGWSLRDDTVILSGPGGYIRSVSAEKRVRVHPRA